MYHILPMKILSKNGTTCRDKSHRKREISALAEITGFEINQHWLKSQEMGAFKSALSLPYRP
jgi:hypothetical protein